MEHRCEKCNRYSKDGTDYCFPLAYISHKIEGPIQTTTKTSYGQTISFSLCDQCLKGMFKERKKMTLQIFVFFSFVTPLLLFASILWSRTIYAFLPFMTIFCFIFWLSGLGGLFEKESKNSYKEIAKEFIKKKRFQNSKSVLIG